MTLKFTATALYRWLGIKQLRNSDNLRVPATWKGHQAKQLVAMLEKQAERKGPDDAA